MPRSLLRKISLLAATLTAAASLTFGLAAAGRAVLPPQERAAQQAPSLPAPPGGPATGVTTIVIVRHAEKGNDDLNDPSLSAAGRARAAALAASLEGADVAAVYATQFKRTRETAEPVAKRFKVPVTVRPVSAENARTYAAGIIREALAQAPGKTVVIVGHSNTVPDLVKAAGAPAPAPLGDGDYDRFFLVMKPASGPSRLFLARYGAPDAPTSR